MEKMKYYIKISNRVVSEGFETAQAAEQAKKDRNLTEGTVDYCLPSGAQLLQE